MKHLKFNAYSFTHRLILYLSILFGILPQVRRDIFTRKIDVLQTLLCFVTPIFFLSYCYWHAWFTLINVTSASTDLEGTVFIFLYTVSGATLYTLNIFRSNKLQNILSFQERLMPQSGVNPSWNFMLFWLLFFFGCHKVIIELNDPNLTQEKTLYANFYGRFHQLRYISISLSSIFVGASIHMYECGCKRVLKLMKEGKAREGIEMYRRLLMNFKSFANAYEYEITNIAMFHTIWFLRMLGLCIIFIITSYDKMTWSILYDKMLIRIINAVGRFVFVCGAASALEVQKQKIIHELRYLKLKSWLTRSNQKQNRTYDQVDIWIQIIKLGNLNLTGFGVFKLDREFIFSVAVFTASFLTVVINGHLKSGVDVDHF